MPIEDRYKSWLLGARDVLDWQGLISKLGEDAGKDDLSPGKRVWELLPESARQLFRGQPTAESQPVLIDAINGVLTDVDFYKEEYFSGITMPVEAKVLSKKEPSKRTDKENLRLNRLLLEAAYPSEIARSYQWVDPARALRGLAAILGIEEEQLKTGEEVDRIHLYDNKFPTSTAHKLTEDVLWDLRESYGSAIRLRLMVGGLDKLKLESLNATRLPEFCKETQHSPSLILDLTLDKTNLLQQWNVSSSDAVIRLFFFSEALVRIFGDGLVTLESGLMSECERHRKLVLLVPSHKTDLALDGDYLAVLGGKNQAHFQDYVSNPSSSLRAGQPSNEREVVRLHKEASKSLKWTRLDLKFLTPLHFKVRAIGKEPDPQDPIAAIIQAQRFTCSVLYTAGETYEYSDAKEDDDPIWRSTFAGDRFLADVEIKKASKLAEMISKATAGKDPFASIEALVELAEWVYSGDRGPSDKLAVVQAVAAQYLQADNSSENCSLLLYQAKAISERVNWAFAAFTRKELDKFFAHVQEIEQSVDSTVKTFNEQVQLLTKTLVDNMLAAVGILVASFIAAIFKDPFEPRIFQTVTLLYAGYLLVFPIIIGLRSTWERYDDSKTSFTKQTELFEKRLPKDEVNNIIGTTVTDRQSWFEKWFRRTTIAYFVVFGLLLLALWKVPGEVKKFADHFSVNGAEFSASTGHLIIRGSHFQKNKEIAVSLGDKSYTNVDSQSLIVHSDEILTLAPIRKDLAGKTTILIRQANADSVEIQLPTLPKLAVPNVDRWEPLSAGDAKTLAAWGSNFDTIKSIKFDGKDLPHSTSPDGTLMHVSVSSPLTDEPGVKQIVFALIDGASVDATLTVGPRKRRSKSF